MSRRWYLVIAVTIAAVVLLSILLPRVTGNRPPVIAGLEAEAERVFPSGSTRIVCSASSAQSDELTYDWSATGGEIHGEGATVTWMAPASEGIYRVTVTVTANRGGEDTSHVEIPVWANRPPTITRLTADAVWTTPSASLQMMCEAEDPDGDELSYVWTATAGSINGTGATVNWTAPEELGMYDITVVVRDAHGGSASRTLPISVVSGQPPVIEDLLVTAEHKYLKKTTSGYLVGEGKEFRIQCTAFHPDGFELSYEWECNGGEISGEGSTITWTAPYTRVDLAVIVTVSYMADNTVSQRVDLKVTSCSSFG